MTWWWLLCEIFISPLVFFSHWELLNSLVHSALGKDISRGNLMVLNYFFPPFTVIQLLYQSSLQSLLQPALGNLGVHWEPGFHPLFILVQTQQCSVTRWFCTGRHQIPPGEWRWSCAMFCTRETVKLANKSCSSGVFLFYSAVIHTFISPSVWTVSSPAAKEFGFFY